jgi:hypothetical protein
MEYIKREWDSMTGELKRMKKRQLLGSAVNLGEASTGAATDALIQQRLKLSHCLLQGWWSRLHSSSGRHLCS